MVSDYQEGLRSELVAAAERQQAKRHWFEWLRRPSKKVIGALGAVSVALLAAGVYGLATAKETGSASCDKLEITADAGQGMVNFKPTIALHGDAAFDSMLYIYDTGNTSQVAQQTEHDTKEVGHTFTTPGTHTITAEVNYELNGKVFGGLPNCEVQVTVAP